MKKMFAKTTLALAVAGVIAAPAFAVDAIGTTSARSNSLLLNYYSHADRDNIWVNPALAAEYRNTVEVTSGGDDTVGGLLYGIGDSQTVGVYLGRSSGVNFGGTTEFGNYPNATQVGNVGNNNDDPRRYNRDVAKNAPNNMFDAFYAMDMGEMAFGARLSVQMVEETQSRAAQSGAYTDVSGVGTLVSNPNDNAYMGGNTLTENLNLGSEAFNGLSTTGLIAKLDKNIATEEAARLTQHGAAPTGRVLVGNITEVSTTGGSWSTDAQEMNVALGFNLKSLGIDGAFQFGTASGEQSRSTDITYKTTEYLRRTDIANTQATRVTSDGSASWKDVAEIDGGTSMALSLRGLLMQTDSSTLHASFLYSTQDYSGKLTSTYEETMKEYRAWQDNGANFANSRTTETETQAKRFEGQRTNEHEAIQVGAAFRNMLSESTALTAVAAFRMDTTDTGSELKRVQDMKKVDTVNATALNTTNSTVTTYNTALGTITHWEQTNETMSLPITLALEHSINERWTVRAAASKEIYKSEEVSRTDYTYSDVPANKRTTDTANTGIAKTPGTTLNDSTTTAAASRALTATRTTTTETTWNGDANVALGLGYANNGVTVDAHFQTGNATLGTVTVGYNW